MKKITLMLVAALISMCTLLSGCITAGIYAAQKTVATIDGSDMNIVTITEKQKDITAINKVVIDMQYLKLESQEKREQKADTYKLVTEALTENGLFQPNNKDGDKLTITVTNVTDSYADKSVQSYVTVYDSKGYQVLSVVYILTGKGLRRLSYVKEKFAEELAEYLKQPVKK